jgi:hypothetical protein
MGNGNPISKISVGHLLPGQHAVNVARFYVLASDQQIARFTDGLLFAAHPGQKVDVTAF